MHTRTHVHTYSGTLSFPLYLCTWLRLLFLAHNVCTPPYPAPAFKPFSAALEVHLVELSPALRAAQWRALRCSPDPAAQKCVRACVCVCVCVLENACVCVCLCTGHGVQVCTQDMGTAEGSGAAGWGSGRSGLPGSRWGR